MVFEKVYYLDAGPIVAVICKNDAFHTATMAMLSDLSGRKVTSYLSILEAFVVLYRAERSDIGESFDSGAAHRLWEMAIERMANAGVEIRSTNLVAPLDEAKAEGMLRTLSVHLITRGRGNGKSWVRSVGVIDCFHLDAAESIGATHFLTTDRCLAMVETGLEMMLIQIHGSSVDAIRPSFMVRDHARCPCNRIVCEGPMQT